MMVQRMKKAFDAKRAFVVLMCIAIFLHVLFIVCPDLLSPRINAFSQQLGLYDDFEWLFSDFFYVVTAIDCGSPYVGEFSNPNYPPLANLVFLPFSYTGDYAGMTLAEARTYLPGLFACVFFILLSSALFFYSLRLLGDKYNFRGWPLLLFLFVPVFLFGVHRANVVLLAGACVNFFLLYYDSEDPKERKKGLLFLCLAVALKLWPVLLGLLILVSPHNKGNRWKEVLWCMVVTTLLMTLPFLCFQGGFKNIPYMIGGLVGWTDGVQKWCLEFGVHNLGLMLGHVFHLSGKTASMVYFASKWMTYMMGVLSVFLFFMDKVYWRRLLLLVLVVLMVPDKVFYYYGIYLFPVVVMYFGIKDKSVWGLLYALCYVLVFSPLHLHYWFLDFENIIKIGSVLLWVLVLVQSSREVLKQWVKRKTNQTTVHPIEKGVEVV